MELVYLWLNNYKGFNNLGIILNAAYEEVKIDYLTANKKVNINIKEKQNYTNIFPKNLNIITLVGRNGSGKSTIVSALNKIIHSIQSSVRSNSTSTVRYDDTLLPEEFCLICKQDNSYIAYCSDESIFSLTIQTLKGDKLSAICSDQHKDLDKSLPFEKRMIKQSKNEKISCAMFQPFLRKESDYSDNFSSSNNIYGIAKIKLNNYFYYDRFRLYDTVRTIQELYKFNNSLSDKNQLEFFKDNNHGLHFEKYSPILNIYDALQWVNNRIQNERKEDNYPIIQTISSSTRTFSGKILSNPRQYTNLDKISSDILPKLFFSYAVGELLESINNPHKIGLLQETNYKKILNNLSQDTYQNREKRIEFYETILQGGIRTRIREVLTAYLEYEKDIPMSKSLSMKDLLNKYYEVVCNKTTHNLPVLQLKRMVSFTTTKKYPSYITQIERLKGISKNLYKDSSNKKYYDFLSLSTGEQRLLRFIADVYLVANMKELKKNSKNSENNIYIFDEMDLSWHPEWQRNMVFYIIDLFDKITANSKNRKINLIFTTHSPIILSDMPKSNVVFLPKEKKTPKDFDTFGANIHDLFKTGLFFNCPNCSTLGAFAKSEILKIRDTLNSDNLTKSEVSEIRDKIEMIGEPIIRNSLMDKLCLKYDSATIKDDYASLKKQNLALKKKLIEYKNKYEKNR